MKPINGKFIKGTSWLLGSLLAAAGFTGCKNEIEVIPMYGCPVNHYRFLGRVTNQMGHPVKGISIKPVSIINPDHPAFEQLTDPRGNYDAWSSEQQKTDFMLIVTDVDGEANGSYQTDTVKVEIAENDYVTKHEHTTTYFNVVKEVNIVLKEKEE